MALKEFRKKRQPKFKRFSDMKIWEKLLVDDSFEDDEEENDDPNQKRGTFTYLNN